MDFNKKTFTKRVTLLPLLVTLSGTLKHQERLDISRKYLLWSTNYAFAKNKVCTHNNGCPMEM